MSIASRKGRSITFRRENNELRRNCELDLSAVDKELQKEGYVLVKGVLNPSEIEKSISLLWDDFEKHHDNLKRDDHTTWQDWTVDSRGIIAGGIGQGSGAWYVRGRPNIRRTFAEVWNTNELLVSMDTILAWKPWWVKDGKKPVTEGLHLDQNPDPDPKRKSYKGRSSVQGMVVLYDVTEEIGGLEVVPRSHLEESQKRLSKYHWWWWTDWCVLGDSYPLQGKGKLVHAKAGDLILWDSRTVHGGWVGDGKVETVPKTLARLAVPVCMTPKAWAEPRALKERKNAFAYGNVLSHWPHEPSGGGGHQQCRSRVYKKVDLKSELFGEAAEVSGLFDVSAVESLLKNSGL